MVLADETAAGCVGFLKAAVEYYRGLGVRVASVMTDNGTGYKNTLRSAFYDLEILHLRTEPYTTRTDGKAKSFVRTSLREWAYARPLESSELRAQALDRFLRCYNHPRPRSALGRLPPISRISPMNNLLELNIYNFSISYYLLHIYHSKYEAPVRMEVGL
jgi:transposase InsO family protein